MLTSDRSRRRQAGETLIEALLALSIFGAAALTVTRAMNEGYARIFASTQQSQVQSIMQGQLTIIRAAHNREVLDPGSTAWDTIVTAIGSGTSATAAVNPDGCTYSANKSRLYFDTTTEGAWSAGVRGVSARDIPVSPSSETPGPNGNNLWVEAQRGGGGSARGYYDFYVKACWDAGGERQQKSVMRLYDVSGGGI